MHGRVCLCQLAKASNMWKREAERFFILSEKNGEVLEWSELGKYCMARQHPITKCITFDSLLFERRVSKLNQLLEALKGSESKEFIIM